MLSVLRISEFPTPERSRICGVPRAPAVTTTSLDAFTTLGMGFESERLGWCSSLDLYSTPTAWGGEDSSNRTRTTLASSKMWRLGYCLDSRRGWMYRCAASCLCPSGLTYLAHFYTLISSVHSSHDLTTNIPRNLQYHQNPASPQLSYTPSPPPSSQTHSRCYPYTHHRRYEQAHHVHAYSDQCHLP
jgi:hypothetical protein